jgi:hypothetical protein
MLLGEKYMLSAALNVAHWLNLSRSALVDRLVSWFLIDVADTDFAGNDSAINRYYFADGPVRPSLRPHHRLHRSNRGRGIDLGRERRKLYPRSQDGCHDILAGPLDLSRRVREVGPQAV